MTDEHIKRDRWGRPLIKLPDSDEVVAYRRASSYGKSLDDLNNLIKWKQRMVVTGMLDAPHLTLKAAAAAGDKRLLNTVCDEAMVAAGSEVKSDIGTSLHSLTERIDRGDMTRDNWLQVPGAYVADLKAYEALVARAGFEWLEIEQFVVHDELRAAGTPDRIARWGGENFIVDLKTGGIGFPHGFAVQLAIYANAKGYDGKTQERRDLPEVNKNTAILIHLPAGQGEASLHWLDISQGIRAAHLARDVDGWRKVSNLTTPITLEGAA